MFTKESFVSIFNLFLATICLFLLLSKIGYTKQISHIGTNQKVLVICVKWKDYSTTRLAYAKNWVELLEKETNKFYKQATFNKTTFQFETISGGPASGWLNLGYNSSKHEFSKTIQDSIKLADPYADFNNYNRVLVITNCSKPGGQGGGPWFWTVSEGAEATFIEKGKNVKKRAMTASIINEWTAGSHSGNSFDNAASVIAHELGHQLNLPTHYHTFKWNGVNRDSITPWGIMGASPGLNHFLGWAKAQRKWITPGSQIINIGPPSGQKIDKTITLRPIESVTTGVQLITIPIVSSSIDKFIGYVVENKSKINGDENIPSQGVLISLVNGNFGPGRKNIVMFDPNSPNNLNLAPLEVGDTYTDSSHNIKITVVSQSGNNYRVRIQYGLPPTLKPDPQITPWNAPPWETPDIWIDSQKNGWNTYKFKDTSGNPVGNGDEAWVGHANRLYVRIKNGGQGVATNVRVRIFINDPPGIGASGKSWKYAGTIILSTISPDNTVEDFIIWKPTVGKHTCIKVEIESSPVELSKTNNFAQENVVHFDTSKNSPYAPVGLKMRVDNPSDTEKTMVYFNVRNIPLGWAVRLEPYEMLMLPGTHDWVELEIFPSGPPRGTFDKALASFASDDKYSSGFIGKLIIEALVPFEDTFIPIGGVDTWIHLVFSTKLTLDYADDKGTPAIDTIQFNRLPKLDRSVEKLRVLPELLFELSAIDIIRLDRIPKLKFNKEIVLTGKIYPNIGGVKIAVEFTNKDKREIMFAHTAHNGTYRLVFVPPASGIWNVRAFFDGSDMYGASESDYVKFEVR